MDDMLFLDGVPKRLAEVTMEEIRMLCWWGCTLNEKKSVLEPAQSFEYLGMVWDKVQMTVELTKEKVKALRIRVKRWIKKVEAGKQVSVRSLAAVVGALAATQVQHQQASLYLTNMLRLTSATTRR
jgi:hypothetical protein